MKKILIAMAVLATATFAHVKLDFENSVNQLGCTLTQWLDHDFESGVKWRYYGKFVCAEKIRVPVRLVGLKLLDVSQNLKGQYVYTYGEE